MNHLDVAKIVQAIDNYFLLFDSESSTNVKAKQSHSDYIDGLIIYRNLRNGWVEVIIDSAYSDKELITIHYHKKGSKSEHDGCLSLTSEDFSLESITKAMRTMIKYDCEVRKPNINDLVLSPNNKDLVLNPKDKTIN